MTIRNIHEAWAWVVIIGNGMAGAWCLAALKLPSLRTRAVAWFTTFAQVAIFLQVFLGVALVAGQDIDVSQFHMLYGFVSIIVVAVLYSYGKQMRSRFYALYGFGGLFIMGLGIRALMTGGQ